jgi:hypothetical protein
MVKKLLHKPGFATVAMALLLLLLNTMPMTGAGQTPQGIYYQSVVRDASGNLVQNTPVSFRFTIHDVTPTGNVIYQQTDTLIPDQFGLITVVIGGGGSIVQGNFGVINWALSSKFLQVEIDVTGGVSYTDMGTTQMLSVPYALYAASAGNADTSWQANGQNIFNTNSGNVGIGTPTPTSTLDVNGPTKLGPNSPKIEMVTFRDTVPLIAGNTRSFNIGVPDSNILSTTVQVFDPVNGIVAPLSGLTGTQYSYSVLGSVFTLTPSLTSSLAILGKPFSVLVIYKR